MMQKQTVYGFVFQLLKLLCLFACLAMKFKELQCHEIQTITETMFCYNSSLEGFRLKATILEVRDISSRSACIDECLAERCCRSLNFKHSTNNQPSKCEFLHDLLPKSSSVLEKNTLYDHVYFIQPQKVYDSSCLPKPKSLTFVSCKDAFENDSSSTNGTYNLRLDNTSEVYQAYCHMSNLSSQCGGGGWTLVMKLDRNKTTLEYNSTFWTNKETFNVEAGLRGLTENETKLASYHNTPFTKICLGMKVDNVTQWILLNYTASSLYNVIADGNHRASDLGRDQWESLVVDELDATLQPNCNKEGFNIVLDVLPNQLYLRIGIVGNDESHCDSPESLIGFGIEIRRSCGASQTSKGNDVFRWSSGSISCNTNFKTFGYIFVQ